ncbi:NAD-dependent epimerase/dehydratase family protein [Hoyosella sp. YIM 151337]|uniref:NAD-dependent epimerase/dehydratase family protein n=1 Tax=Hoyosella sp. YIM 151337 TaxID=2992742 RepID=UPI00223581CE|nr:NAD-dependent epimerase/dehydratase family protein [Hoyosella sp. YIM 151337]MCW4355907.1 NAD-dependent epimerase/dehydratase family protein [Hoyosella sp. YIM 151337]
MNIVITGASGNVGTALLRALASDAGGPHHVVGICRRRPPPEPPYDTAEWVRADISELSAERELRERFRDADAVVHLAWLIQPSHNQDALKSVNRDGTRRVISAALDEKVPHLVHMSSIGTYASAEPGTIATESWPHDGIPSSYYSVDKAFCEHLLDGIAAGETTIARVRPTLILHEPAASEVARYFLGPLVPTVMLREGLLRFAPLPNELHIQFIHADDVARAITHILHRRAGGAFNLAATPVIDRESWAQIFGGTGPPAPVSLLRAGAALSWRLRLQPTGPGWLDMGIQLPLLDCSRAHTELDWHPEITADELLPSFFEALRNGTGSPSPPLIPRKGLQAPWTRTARTH